MHVYCSGFVGYRVAEFDACDTMRWFLKSVNLVSVIQTTTTSAPVVTTTLPVQYFNQTSTITEERNGQAEGSVPVPLPSPRDGCRADDQVRCLDGTEYIWLMSWKYFILLLPISNSIFFFNYFIFGFAQFSLVPIKFVMG